MKNIEAEFRRVLEELATALTETDVSQIKELIEAGEIGVAFENFCTQLGEREATCSATQKKQIAAVGQKIGIDPRYWADIPPL